MCSVRIVILGLVFVLTGCGTLNSVYRPFNISEGSGALIDIKQRAIVVSPQTTTDKEGKKTQRVIVCAEPSPDALSAYAAEVAAKAEIPKEAAVQLAAAMSEGTAYVGLRTQSIQLLRDALYRLCEGYMSGALDKDQYDILVRRYQKYMVALLGIEQLTGAMRSPAVTINTEGSAEAARSISTMEEEIKEIKNKVAELEGRNVRLAEEKTNKAGTPDEKKIENEIAENQKTIESFNKNIQSISKGVESARGLAARGSATTIISQVSLPAERANIDKSMEALSKVVKEIVLNVIQTDDLGQLCFAHLKNNKSQNAELTKICKDHFNNLNKGTTLNLEVAEKGLKLYEQWERGSQEQNSTPDANSKPAPDASSKPAPDTSSKPAPDASSKPAPDANSKPKKPDLEEIKEKMKYLDDIKKWLQNNFGLQSTFDPFGN